MRISWFGPAALVAALVGCGSVADTTRDSGGGDDQPSDFALTVAPTSLSIPINSTGTATITVARTGGDDAVTLSADAGANLTVAFSPNPIPAGSTTADVTVTATGGKPASMTDVTITGTVGSNHHDATLSVTTTTLTVSGIVRGARQGITVGIVGKNAITSGAGGAFSFSDVVPPYDIYTIAPSGFNGNSTEVNYFAGLTRTDPTVTAGATFGAFSIFCGISIPCSTSAVSGTKSGAGNVTDPVIIEWVTGSSTTTLAGNSTYSFTASYGTAATSIGSLYGLQFTRKASGGPDVFLGFAKSPEKTLSKGVAQTIDLAFSTVANSGAVSGTITNVAGFNAPSMSLYQQIGTGIMTLWQTNTTTTVDANFPMLATAGGNSFYVSSSDGTASTNYVYPLTQTSDVTFQLVTPATLSVPVDAAVDVTTTSPFQWTSPTGVINELGVSCGAVHYNVFTTANQAHIPELPGAPLPAAQSCSWSVSGYAPNSDVNASAAANQLETALIGDFSGPAHASTVSGTRTFTTP
ncbi:MAG TPA: hypothetical protein VGM90_12765 [Kofleriaceae bacterium]|jgi:hypothetical protein